MSLYELESTMQALANLGKTQGLSPEEVEATRSRVAERFKDDPRVRLK